jgi:hypothetical protein
MPSILNMPILASPFYRHRTFKVHHAGISRDNDQPLHYPPAWHPQRSSRPDRHLNTRQVGWDLISDGPRHSLEARTAFV